MRICSTASDGLFSFFASAVQNANQKFRRERKRNWKRNISTDAVKNAATISFLCCHHIVFMLP
jgi:hypothetical protein